LSNNFYHERDFRQSRTHVLVRGVGTEAVGGVTTLVHAEYTTHVADYPCRYLPEGWGGEPYFDADIDTLAKAQDVATALGDAVWGALGTLGWHTDGVPVGSTTITRFRQGDLIAVDDPLEGQADTVYPIRHVERVPGTTGWPVWALTVGDEPPDVLDLIRGITVIRPIQQALAGTRGAGGGAGLGTQGMPGTPRQMPVSRTPTNSAAAVVKPQFNDTTGVTIQGNAQDRDPATPILPASYAPSFAVTPAATDAVPDPAPGTWTTHGDGRPHPQVYPMGFSVEGSTERIVVPWDTSINRIKVKGTGTATLNKNGVAAAGPFSPAAGWQAIDPPVLYSEVADDDWSVTVSGVSGSLSVAISEP
jgi:hypothetical protein